MFPQNLHTHTILSDGKHTPEEMVLGAAASGCASLGFSEHSPMPAETDPVGWAMSADQEENYRAEILRLKESYRDRMEIFLGLELDVDSAAPRAPYEYLIGSVHGVWRDGRYLSIDESPESFRRFAGTYFGGDHYALAAAYFQRTGEFAAKGPCQIVGHFDLVAKFNEGGKFFDESDPRYVKAALEALEAAMTRDVIFEINTGAISRGWRAAPYPAPFLLKAIREKGGRICISSDSHHKDTIVCAFSDAAALAADCGFREAWVLTKNRFQPVGLESYLVQ